MKKPKLNISSKNFLYNIILTLLICTIIFSYMAFYMPNVYLEKKIESAENIASSVHDSFIKNKNYNNLNEIAKEGMYSYFIPKGKDKVVFSGLRFNLSMTIKNENIKNLLRSLETDEFKEINSKNSERLINPLIKEAKKELEKYVIIDSYSNINNVSKDTFSIKRKNNSILIKAESKTKDSIATNLILISKHSEGTYVSIYPYIFNSISDIKSTVISAFPVIFLLIVMIVFLLNKIYSKSITQPILKMNNFTKVSKNQKNAKYDLEIHTNDEIEELSNNLKLLYETLTENYKILEKNTKKKEIFIKSTSHELKTPLQTAILLNDSMIEKIGKYEDTDKYLPELRKKLYQIQILIDDLLFINKIDENPIMENLKLSEIMKESVKNHHDLIAEKNLKVTIKGEKSDIVDYDHFRIIFDNLLKNAIEYTDFGGNICCDFNDVIEISNNPTTVDKNLLNKITHPFVSSTKNKSKGIGMYIVENLLEDMNYKIKIVYSSETFTVKILKTN